jgi:cytochrome c oxidase subunit III
MNAAINLETPNNKKISPKLFILYVSFGSMFMFFSALCSAIIVKRGDFNHWEEVTLPSSFLISTIIIIISSFSLQWAYKHIDDKPKFRLYGYMTFILALVFIIFQLNGWAQLKAAGVLFTGNPSGTFIYVVSLLHGIHYIGGIFFLGLLMFFNRKGIITESKKDSFNVLTQYWHYIGVVWVILYVFFKFLIYN